MRAEAYRQMIRVEEEHWWYVGMRAIARQLLNAGGAEGSLIDVGCGSGGFLLGLVGQRDLCIGADRARLPLETARERGIDVVQADATRLPFADASFDQASGIDVLYHQGVGDDGAAMQELRRVLRPGGRLVVQVPAYDWLRGAHDDEVFTRERYSAGAFRARLAGAGLEVERLTHANAVFLPLAIVWRILSRAVPGGQRDLEVPPAPLNAIARGVLGVERRWIARRDLPFGLSLLAVARRSDPHFLEPEPKGAP